MNEEVKIAVVPPAPTDANGHELFGPAVINTDAIKALTDEELDTVLAILTKAGY